MKRDIVPPDPQPVTAQGDQSVRVETANQPSETSDSNDGAPPVPNDPLPPEIVDALPVGQVANEPEARMADCCGQGDGASICIGGIWHLILWAGGANQDGEAAMTTIAIRGVMACPFCGEMLGMADTANYHWGRYAWLDKAVRRAAAVRPVPTTTPTT